MAQHLGAETVEPRRRANDPVVAAVAMQGLAHDVEAHAVRLARDEEVVPRMPAAEVWQVGAPATPDVAAGHTHPQPVGGAARLACPQGRVPQHSEGGRGGSAGGVRTLHANNSRCKFGEGLPRLLIRQRGDLCWPFGRREGRPRHVTACTTTTSTAKTYRKVHGEYVSAVFRVSPHTLCL